MGDKKTRFLRFLKILFIRSIVLPLTESEQTNSTVQTLPAGSDNQLGKVNSFVRVKRPVVNNVWVVTICCKLFSIDVKTSLVNTQTQNTLTPLSLSLSFPVGGTGHRPNRLQEAHHASWVGRVDVVGGGACLHVSRTVQE